MNGLRDRFSFQPDGLRITLLLMWVVLLGSGVMLLQRWTATPASALCAETDAAKPAAAAGAVLDVKSTLAQFRLVNYYPADSAQTNMWSNWNPTAVRSDFERMAAMHANTVRIAVYPDTFGYPKPEPFMLDRLAQLFDLADKQGLRVQLKLFAFWSRYDDLAGSQVWAACVLAPYGNDPRLAAIDLYNELDTSDERALGWVHAIVPAVRAAVGRVPLTVSVSDTDGLAGLRRLVEARIPVDFYELHYYGKPTLAYATFEQARGIVGAAPLFIGETGYSTIIRQQDRPELAVAAWIESYQDQYHRTVQYAASALGLPPAAPWTLNDFTPGAFPGNSRSGLEPGEYVYGLYRTDGTAKPAAQSLRTIFEGKPVDLSFNNGFEAGATPDIPANWLTWEPACASFARDAAVAHSGEASASISGSTACPDRHPSLYVAPVRFVLPERGYRASVFARGRDVSGGARLTLAWFGADGTFLRTDSSASLPAGTSGWTELTVQASAPAQARTVEIHLQSSNNSGAVWFDDVAFNEVDASRAAAAAGRPIVNERKGG